MKNIKTTLRNFYNYVYIGFVCAVSGITPMFADDPPASEAVVETETVFSAGGNLMDNLVTQLTDFYCGKAFWLLAVVNLVLLAFTKNDKKVELYKKSLIIICVVYALLKCSNLVTSTIDSLLQGAGAF